MDWQEPLAVAMGALTGVLSGICVEIGAKTWFARQDLRRQLGNMYYELEYIRMKHDEYLDKLARYVERVESGNCKPTSMYFDMGKVLAPSFHAMHRKGGLYRFLAHEDLSAVMSLAGKFSPGYEEYFNKEVRRMLDKAERGDAVTALSRLNGWITDLKKDREAVDQVMRRLSRHTPKKMQKKAKGAAI